MTNIAGTANSKASRGLRFLFAPQLLGKGSLQPVKNILLGFVQLIAEFLSTAQLLPATHRALRPTTAGDARIGEVLAIAYSNLRRPGTRLDQYAVFGGVIALFGLITLMSCYTAFTMLVGTAHAGITLTFSFTGCNTAGTFFTTGCTNNDMAQQWIDALLLGDTSAWWLGQAVFISPAMQAGLGAMFQTYSYAMLVLAGFLVIYHLVVVIAGTAHEGRMGGRLMNQIWAPIRLVAAIGMLVPIGVNGLNSGQVIAIQVTKWGSGLASNAWIAFANAFTDSPYVILPPIPQTVPVLQNALLILTCQSAYERVAQESGSAFTTGVEGWFTTTSDPQNIYKSWYYQNKALGSDRVYDLCGRIEMLNPDYVPNGTASQFLSSGSGLDASLDLRKAVLQVQRDTIDDAMYFSLDSNPLYDSDGNVVGTGNQVGSRLAKLADKLYLSADGANTNYILKISDILDFNIAVGEYRTALETGIRAAVIGSSTLAGMSMTTDAMSRGWMSASVWFNTIAKINGMLIDYSKSLPKVKFNYIPMLDQSLTERTQTAFASAYDIMGQIPQMAAVKGSTVEEPLSYANNVSDGSPMDQYLFMLANRVKGILGNTTASPDEITPGALPAYASGLQLNTANPLAELSALGHRMVEAAFAVNNAVTQSCYSNAKAAAANDPNGDAISRASAGSDCGGSGSYMETDPGTSMLMASVSASMVMAGITLAFVLPLLPFVRFLFGILTWIIAVIETVIAIPVVALAHIKMDGDGFSGPMARSAYMLLLQVFLRPVLMVFGLLAALLVFNLMIVALNEFYSQAVRSAEGGGSVSALAAVVYTVVYVSLAYGLANASFKAIDMIPNQCLMWIGGATQQSMDGTQYLSQATASVSQAAPQALPAAMARTELSAAKGYYGSGRY